MGKKEPHGTQIETESTIMKYIFHFLILLAFASCNSCNNTTPTTQQDTVAQLNIDPPVFNSDSAYQYIESQLAFGPRNMNSKGHEQCAQWLIAKIKSVADTVYVQKFDALGFDGVVLKGTNIIASFNPEAKERVLLCSHWDSRPWADQDTKDRNKPILAACDGAGGIGILMEIANAIKSKPTQIGVDIFFIDAEDYGYSSSLGDLVKVVGETENSFCLGSQHWAANPHVPGYRAAFGILLDMAVAKNAVFTREGTSQYNAAWVQDKIWNNAQSLGYGSLFSSQNTSPITDDHLYINQIAKIPTVDIIHFDASTPSGFGAYWHTHNDNMDVVGKPTIESVGKVLLYTLYQRDAEYKIQ
jgi:hypothetical protein